jgi:hypothetical protein
MIAAFLLLLAASQAAALPPRRDAQAADPAAPSEAELQEEAAREAQVNWGHSIALPNLSSKYPIGKVRRLRIVNNTGGRVTIEGADYPGRDATEELARTLRPGGRATLTLIAPPGACRVRLVTRPRLALGPFDICRRGSVTLRH